MIKLYHGSSVLSGLILRVEEYGILGGFLVRRIRKRMTHLQFVDAAIFSTRASEHKNELRMNF